jgi:hypothetical protein
MVISRLGPDVVGRWIGAEPTDPAVMNAGVAGLIGEVIDEVAVAHNHGIVGVNTPRVFGVA